MIGIYNTEFMEGNEGEFSEIVLTCLLIYKRV